MKSLPWSHTALTGFKTCPRQYAEVKVYKRFKDEMGEAALKGNDIHAAIEKYYGGDALTSENVPDILNPFLTHIELAIDWTGGLSYRPSSPGSHGRLMFFEYKMGLNTSLKRCDWFAKDIWSRAIADVLVIDENVAYVIDWKGLDCDTEIPTLSGFTKMRDIQPGDFVFGGDGKSCRVLNKSAVHNRSCFRVSFDDKTSVICDDEHLWKLVGGAVVPVLELRKGDKILLAQETTYPPAELPIDPYVLGLWLADGKHTSGEITKPDAFVWDEVQRRGFTISHDYAEKAEKGKCRVHTVKGLRTLLRQAALLGHKHIPDVYMHAHTGQRIDLLRGLMDGDGNANPARKQAVFTTCDRALSNQVKELLASLGQRPNQSVVTAHGFGKTVQAYPIAFRPQGLNPFSMPRKAERILESWGRGRSWYRAVLSVEEVPSRPTQCIEVDSWDNTYLCTRDYIPTHNTGKVKPDNNQLKLFALFVFYHFPWVSDVHTSFEWLGHNQNTRAEFKRIEISALWSGFTPDLRLLKEAFSTETWQEKPSGLCNGWCPVTDCQHWKPKR